MSPESFTETLSDAEPPQQLSESVTALWWQGKGDWERAHTIVQDLDHADAALVHAHLHRVEGDLGNAGYWYRRAGRPQATCPLEDEWQALVREFLER